MNPESPHDADANDDDADEEPSPEELAEIRRATPADAAAVDALLLGHCTDRWYKVARVVGASLDDFEARCPHLPYVYMQLRLAALIERGTIECQGDVMSMRSSEIRLTAARP